MSEEKEKRFLKWSLELDSILDEMEDLQIRLLSLHVRAQFTRSLMEDEMLCARLDKDLRKS